MGCGMSTEEKEGKARNEEIENQLKRDKMSQRSEIKMLLLGMYPLLSDQTRITILIDCRSRRIGQIHHPEADEAHPRGELFTRRARIFQGDHLQQYGPVNACHT